MAVISESKLRTILKSKDIKELYIEKGDILTPSARELLSHKKIEVKIKDKDELQIQVESPKEEIKKPKYIDYYTGAFYYEKPEHMTQLNSNMLVLKSDKKIELRGKLDSLQSKILELQLIFKEKKKAAIVKDLSEVLEYTKDILKAEVLDEELLEYKLLGFDIDELRKMSHNPKEYFGVDHLFRLDHNMDEACIYLNTLRTLVREVEIKASQVFISKNGQVKRLDILKGLNRLSSCVYVMMLKAVASKYR